MAKRSRNSMAAGLVLVRVVTGAVFLVHGWGWVQDGGFDGAVVRDGVQATLSSADGLAGWWGRTVLLTNPDACAFFWRWAALLIGLAFVFGALVRPAGAFAVLLLAHAIAFGPSRHELVFLLLAAPSFACSISGAGRRFGMDAMLDEHLPGWVTWTKRPGSPFAS